MRSHKNIADFREDSPIDESGQEEAKAVQKDVFISYSRKDKEFVSRLHDSLVERDRNVWVDWEGIPPTAEWLIEIKSSIDNTTVFFCH